MRCLNHMKLDELEKYDNIIGWGTGPILKLNYQSNYYKMKYLIDGTEKMIGESIFGIDIKSPSFLCHALGKVLIVIYAIYEKEILEQISQYCHNQNVDIINYALLDITLENGIIVPKFYSKNGEDIILFSLINQLGLNEIQYIEIGVCHPIVRNNTYMINELFSQNEGYHGVLVEANPMCWSLIEDYRKKDVLLKMGISGQDNVSELTFYAFPDLLGHSTFNNDLANEIREKGYECKEYLVPVKRINDVISENFCRVPDILAVDAEGLDWQILCDLDCEKYPIKIIVAENMEDSELIIEELMKEKGYKIYAKTIENTVWTRIESQIFM